MAELMGRMKTMAHEYTSPGTSTPDRAKKPEDEEL
jgi:hypothetical protein